MRVVGDFGADGCALLPALISGAVVERLRGELPFPAGGPGSRQVSIDEHADVAALLTSGGALVAAAERLMDVVCRPVRTLLFDKTPAASWSVRVASGPHHCGGGAWIRPTP